MKFLNKDLIQKVSVYGFCYLMTGSIIASVFLLHPKNINNLYYLRIIIISFASVLLLKYFFYMLLSPWHDVSMRLRDRKFRKEIKNYNPKVSVLIPAWNEEFGIIETIKTLLKSTHKNMELIVINDGSTDNSDKLIRDFVDSYYANKKSKVGIDIIYHYKANGGKGAALNTAIGLASGEILLSIDADCVVMPDTVKNFVRCFVDPEVKAAVGNVKIGSVKKLIGSLQYLEFLFSFYFKKADSFMNTIYIIGGAAGAFRKEVFEKLGGYNTKNITEDIDLSVRIQGLGMKIVYVDDAIVYTEGAAEIKGLMKQRLRWKRGRFETFMENKDLFFSTKKEHNKLLTWIILPLAWFGEVQLSSELFFLLFLYVYSYLGNDFSSFISGIVVVGSMFFIQMFFDDTKTQRFSFYILMPIGWLLFYISTYVEFNALFKSIWGLVRKQELKWQKWQRQGVHG